jgi:hypothetical protein
MKVLKSPRDPWMLHGLMAEGEIREPKYLTGV